VTNGVYTAPAVISLQQTVKVAAASAADPTKIATASVTLVPSVSVSVSPTSVSLTPSQSQQFSVSLSGTTNPNVTWSMSPSVGSLGNGLYQAPATISSQQTVTVTVTSLADSTKTGSATITLVPTVGIALTPSSISLTGGQSTQFNVTSGGAPASASSVTWTLAPQVGNITNGVYTAPVTISAAQTILLTVASIVDPSQTASASISLGPASAMTIAPASTYLSAGQSTQFNVLINGIGSLAVTWSLMPAIGTVVNGLYTAPATITTPQNVTLIAASAADPSKTAQASITLAPPQPITLPVEVAGLPGVIESVTVPIPPGTNLSGVKLWMQIHGLRYADKASVQVNNSPWVPIDDNTVTLLDQAKAYGGVGGGFGTLKMTLDLPDGTLVAGNNTVSFRFNGPSGIGFRVLKFNFLESDGTMILPASLFQDDDPTTWQPPLTSAADIAEGKQLFQTASIVHAGVPVNAHCNNCHTQDGRDLKYFNYSNKFIHVGAVRSGLTDLQGDQIASYIRSLTTPAPAQARPWNPPYQPGPGLDSKPVEEWAAGAGLDAVLEEDTAELASLMATPGNLGAAAYLNPRETPISLQLLDWNNWLPQINPLDAFGAGFAPFQAGYQKVRRELEPGNGELYAKYKSDLLEFLSIPLSQKLFATIAPTGDNTNPLWQNPSLAESIYGFGKWGMVKLWEINQEYGLESLANYAFSAETVFIPANVGYRAWFTNQPFIISPNFMNIPGPNPGIENGTREGWVYDSFIWYHTQLILNDGNGTAQGTWPIDRGYMMGFLINTFTWDPSTVPGKPTGDAGILLEWLVKILQSGDPNDVSPYFLVRWPGSVSSFNDLTFAQRAQYMNTWVTLWLAQMQTYTPTQLFAVTHATSTFVATVPGSFTGDLSYSLAPLRYYGADSTLLDKLVTWASGIWPTHNWQADLNMTCVPVGSQGNIACK
jgi:cytochrome c553